MEITQELKNIFEVKGPLDHPVALLAWYYSSPLHAQSKFKSVWMDLAVKGMVDLRVNEPELYYLVHNKLDSVKDGDNISNN